MAATVENKKTRAADMVVPNRIGLLPSLKAILQKTAGNRRPPRTNQLAADRHGHRLWCARGGAGVVSHHHVEPSNAGIGAVVHESDAARLEVRLGKGADRALGRARESDEAV